MTFTATHPELERRAKAAFDEIIDLASDDRDAAVARACEGDAALRARLESLLAAHDAAENFLDPPPPLFGFDLESASSAARGKPTTDGDDPLIGQHIARYRLLRRLGAGGMGVVYLAQQDQPARQVALKVMRAGLASRSMLRRFEHEAEVLGQLRHPGIAQIFEAGTFDLGLGAQPYFAMEFIDGRTLTDFAKTRELDTKSKLELLAQVCDAVHHAHQKGVVHRDLKPDNILVPDRDEETERRRDGVIGHREPSSLRLFVSSSLSQPKILDFGVARLTDSDFAVSTLKTDLGQIVGTLPYMSPEQIAADPSQVDTRSDVYALGVLGFELLTGELPLNVKHKSMAEAARIIADHDAPSLTSSNRVYRGDISTIISKALEKDRTRRYQSASDLGEDIRRFLRHEPISARPATTLYQLQKFARRNKPLVAGILGVLLMLVLGIVGTSIGLVQARESARIAKQQEGAAKSSEQHAQRQKAAAQESEREAAKQREAALQVSRFLQQMLASINPSFAQGRDTSLLRAILDNASARVERELSGQPDIAATLHNVIGSTYASISEYDEAIEHLRVGLGIRRRILPPDSPDITQSLGNLGRTLTANSQFEEAMPFLREACDRALAAAEVEPSTAVRALLDLGNLQKRMGDYRGARRDFEDALERANQTLSPDDGNRLSAMNDLGSVLMAQQRFAEAQPLLQEAVEVLHRAGQGDTLNCAVIEGNLARVLRAVRDRKAIEHSKRSLEICRRILPPDHDRLAWAISNHASTLYGAGEYEQAETLVEETLRICRETFGPQHPSVANALSSRVGLLEVKQEYAEAERVCREALAMRRATLPEDHRDIATSLKQLAGILNRRATQSESLALMREALRIQQLHGENDYDACETMLSLGMFEYHFGDMAKAEHIVGRAAELFRNLMGEEHRATVGARSRLAFVLDEQGKFDQSLPHHRFIVEARINTGDEDNEIGGAQRLLGRCLIRLDRAGEAEPILREALARGEKTFGADHIAVSRWQCTLGICLLALRKYDEAEALLLESDRRWSPRYAGSPQSRETREALIALYRATNRPDEVAKWEALKQGQKPTGGEVPNR